MTLTPEARAKELVIEIAESFAEGTKARDSGARWAGRYSSWAVRIACAIRAAENDMAERAAVLCDDRRRLSESRRVQSDAHETISHVTTCCALDIRALKHKD